MTETIFSPDTGICDSCGSPGGHRYPVYEELDYREVDGVVEKALVELWVCAVCRFEDEVPL